MTIKVRLAKDYKRATHSVDQTKVNKIDWKEVDPSSNSVQNLLDAGILVRKDEEPKSADEESVVEKKGSDDESEEKETDQESDGSEDQESEEEMFDCDKCEKSFDSERGVKAHKAQVH